MLTIKFGKRLLSAVLAICLLSGITANGAQLTQAQQEEVKLVSVVTHKEITDDEQLLELAVKQYPSQTQIASELVTPEGATIRDNLVATQVLKEEHYSNGTVNKRVARTVMLIKGPNGEMIGPYDTKLSYWEKTGAKSGLAGKMEFCVDETTTSGYVNYVQPVYIASSFTAGASSSTKIKNILFVQQEGVQVLKFEQEYPQPGYNQCVLPVINDGRHFLVNDVLGLHQVTASAEFYYQNNVQFTLQIFAYQHVYRDDGV